MLLFKKRKTTSRLTEGSDPIVIGNKLYVKMEALVIEDETINDEQLFASLATENVIIYQPTESRLLKLMQNNNILTVINIFIIGLLINILI